MADTTGSEPVFEGIKGVFSTRETTYIGHGATKRKVESDAYYYGEENKDGYIDLVPLNANWVPSGTMVSVLKEEFVGKFAPEPDIYTKKTIPALKELSKTLAKAERLRKQGNPYTAEFEYQNALKIDEKNIRAIFGLGLTLLERGDTKKADDVFEELVEMEATYQKENKHLFNEFGISLRKNAMLDQALAYYSEALKTAPEDDHLLFNIARTLYDKGDFAGALEHVKKAGELGADFPELKEFKAVLEKKLG